jgi:hypothetical protein
MERGGTRTVGDEGGGGATSMVLSDKESLRNMPHTEKQGGMVPAAYLTEGAKLTMARWHFIDLGVASSVSRASPCCGEPSGPACHTPIL